MQYALNLALTAYLWFCAAVFVVYLPRMSYYFAAFRAQKRFVNPVKNRIAVLVPARKESAVIAACLDSLSAQTYDSELYDIYVVVDDPADPTVGIAAKYAHVFVSVVENQTCKGDALDGALQKIYAGPPDRYAAYIVIDADNLAAPDFVEEMNNALASERQIIIGKKLVKNWLPGKPRSFVANCTGLTYAQVDDLGNKARTKRGITVNICGTGMMVRADVIDELGGWPYRSLTEDLELTVDAMLSGYSSGYYEHARVYTEEAVKRKTAFKRKMRWIKGFTQCNRKYRRRL
ncbi:MAG: glycosyltransferase family 2 protein, partial [Firmicutes bacterium]|nr:glycosyltransferase family 2 protein [Bacillota bacterium]